MPKIKRERKRDDRDYDKTQLRESGHGKTLGRDYSAHFFRWSFARRFVKNTDHVLEVGCGQDKPLSKLLLSGIQPYCATYTGVDLNRLEPGTHARKIFYGEFNFIERYKELLKAHPKGYDVVVHLEVIEHMKVEHGSKLLKACLNALKPGGVMLMSTPCYDGVRHAANHIHEYTVPELEKAVKKAGFTVEKRYGTFMDIKEICKRQPTGASSIVVQETYKALSEYYDNDAISCIFAPLFPDHARNNLWVCKKPIS